MPKLDRSEEFHDEITRLFRLYFIANQRWLKYGYKQSAIDARSALMQISKLSYKRQKLILSWRREYDTELRMYQEYLETGIKPSDLPEQNEDK